jgi:hypothetical protein
MFRRSRAGHDKRAVAEINADDFLPRKASHHPPYRCKLDRIAQVDPQTRAAFGSPRSGCENRDLGAAKGDRDSLAFLQGSDREPGAAKVTILRPDEGSIEICVYVEPETARSTRKCTARSQDKPAESSFDSAALDPR